MKKRLLIGLLVLITQFASAQISETKNPKHLLLIGVRSDPIMWNELGYMYLGKKHLNFQVKGSFAINYVSPDGRSLSGPYNGSTGFVDFVSSYCFIKPGFVLLKKNNRTNTFFLLVNGMLSYAKNELILTSSDPLLGNVRQVNSENHFYQAIELEANWHLDLGKHVAISVGGLVGGPFQKPVLFQDVYNGAFSNREVYSPGTGYYKDAYFMLNLGLVIKPY